VLSNSINYLLVNVLMPYVLTQSHCVVLTIHVNFLVAAATAGCRAADLATAATRDNLIATIADDAADKRAAKVFSITLYQRIEIYTARTM
jgi:hypothetical protein